MGFPVPVIDYSRPLGSMKEYLILLYLQLISSDYYKNGKSLILSYYQCLFLWYNAGNMVLDSNTSYVPFKLKDKIYKFPLIIRPSSNFVKKITDDKGNDLSEWTGPFKNFYGIKLRPSDLGYKKVIITYDYGEEKVFDEHNDIDI